jgi:aminomethyltransferase
MHDLVGNQIDVFNMPFYGLAKAKVAERDCIISQTGFSGEEGYEIYLLNSTLYADEVWDEIVSKGKNHNLMVTAPSHCRRIQAGILSWGQDMDNEHNPFQCNLGYQVSLSGKGEWDKKGDYIGKKVLEEIKGDLKEGKRPFKLQLVGLEFSGKPILDFATDFWPILNIESREPVGFVTSPWYHPDKKTNIAMGYVPYEGDLSKNNFPIGKLGKKYLIELPEKYQSSSITEEAIVVPIPFTKSKNPNTREVIDNIG